MEMLQSGVSTTDDLLDAVNILTPMSMVHKKFTEASRSSGQYNYIVTGDSTRYNSFNLMIPYYIKQLAKIGWDVTVNAESGLKTAEWNASSRDASLDAAILATPGDGSTTILEYSLGINDSGTLEERKATFAEGIEAYLAAKPKATVLLVSPVGSISGRTSLTGIYKELSSELGLDLVDGSIILDEVSRDSRYMTDGVHPNPYGSRRIVNGILNEIIPNELKSLVTMEDEAKSVPPSMIFTPVVQQGYWSVSNGELLHGAGSATDKYRSFEKIAVEPNFMLRIDHGGNMHHCVFYDINGELINWASSKSVDGSERELLIPNGVYFIGLNISSEGATWDSLAHPFIVEYKVAEVKFMAQPEINKGLSLNLPYLPNRLIDSNGNLPTAGQVLQNVTPDKTVWKEPSDLCTLRGSNVGIKVINDDIFVGYKLGDDDLFWHFAQRGVNNAFSCNRLLKFTNQEEQVGFIHDFGNAAAYIGGVDTDWIGPYMCKLQSEATSYTFVGGHHDATGGTSSSGTPTARSTGFTMEIDGEIRRVADMETYAQTVKFKTTNYVQTNNPDSTTEILRQDVIFTVNALGLHVEINTTALEDIRIDRFYGIQCYAKEGFDKVRFIGDNTPSGDIAPDAAGTSADDAVVRTVHHQLNDGNIFTSFLDNVSGGDFRYKGNNPCASRSNFKTYFNCIYSNINFNRGDTFKIHGGYSVTPVSAKTGGASGLSVNPTYSGFNLVADFQGSVGASTLQLDTPVKGQRLTDIKTQGVTVPDFIDTDIRVTNDGTTTDVDETIYFKYL